MYGVIALGFTRVSNLYFMTVRIGPLMYGVMYGVIALGFTSVWGHCSRFHKSFESLLHDGTDWAPHAEGVGATNDFEQTAGGEFLD